MPILPMVTVVMWAVQIYLYLTHHSPLIVAVLCFTTVVMITSILTYLISLAKGWVS